MTKKVVASTRKKKGQKESSFTLCEKWKSLYAKVIDKTANDFELSMFKAFERELAKRKYPFGRRVPLFLSEAG